MTPVLLIVASIAAVVVLWQSAASPTSLLVSMPGSLDRLIPLNQAGHLVPGLHVHRNTLTRWRLFGVKGTRLRCQRIGGRWFTTGRWLGEFFAALNGEKPPPAERPDAAQRARSLGV